MFNELLELSLVNEKQLDGTMKCIRFADLISIPHSNTNLETKELIWKIVYGFEADLITLIIWDHPLLS